MSYQAKMLNNCIKDPQELKIAIEEVKKMMHDQNENINKEKENLKRNYKKFWSFKRQYWNEKFTRKVQRQIEKAEEGINELKIGPWKLLSQSNNNKKRLNKRERYLIDLQGTIKTNIYIVGVFKGEKKEKDAERMFGGKKNKV